MIIYKEVKEDREPSKHIFCHYTHSRPLGWGQKVKTFFSECGLMLHIKLKERSIDQHRSKNFDLTHTLGPDLWVGLKDQILKLYR